MTFTPRALERAFILARSGDYAGAAEIRAQLHAEGYNAGQLEGPCLLRQLKDLCAKAQRPS